MGEPRLEDLLDLDERAPAASNAERARQQAFFQAREVEDLKAAIAADDGARNLDERSQDPRKAELTTHRQLELLCREIAAAFDWLAQKDRPSSELDFALDHIRSTYDVSPEISLLRAIAETEYPLLTSITHLRQNGVGLLVETQLSLKHAARGRPLSDRLSLIEAGNLFADWLKQAAVIAPKGTVHLLPVREALEWLSYMAEECAKPGVARVLEDDLEATIYLARMVLDETGFTYVPPDGAVPGY